MRMPLGDMENAKKEIASSNDDNQTPKITDFGYLYLSQQINSLMQMQNEFRNNMEIRFDNLRLEIKSEIKNLSDKTDAKFDEISKENKSLSDKTDAKFDEISKENKNLSDKTDAKFETLSNKTSANINALSDKTDLKLNEVNRDIKNLSDKTDAKFNALDLKINALSDKTDAGFDKVDLEVKEIRKEINGLQRWAFALIITVIIGFVTIYLK